MDELLVIDHHSLENAYEIAKLINIVGRPLFQVLNNSMGKFLQRFKEENQISTEELEKKIESEEFSSRLWRILLLVQQEANQDKVLKYRKALSRFYNGPDDFEEGDIFLNTLSQLSARDLLILNCLYKKFLDKTTPFRVFHTNIIVIREVSEESNTNEPETRASLKRLASQGLVDEMFDQRSFYTDRDSGPNLAPLYYAPNDIGQKFLLFLDEIE